MCIRDRQNPDPDAFHGVRGMDGWKEAAIDINGTEVKVAVVSGLGNARKLIEAVRRGEVFYHFVEVMACPGGCVDVYKRQLSTARFSGGDGGAITFVST